MLREDKRMADLLKLAIGDHITLRVDRVEVVRSGKWPEYHWHGRNAAGSVVVVTPQQAADRQLANNLKMTLAQVEGEVITIERAPNKEDATKSWWNLDLASAADLKAAPSPKRLKEPSPEDAFAQSLKDDPQGRGEAAEGQDDLLDAAEQAKEEQKRQIGRVVLLYLGLWDKVAAHQTEYAKAHDFPVDGSSVNSAAATIFIELNKRGLLK